MVQSSSPVLAGFTGQVRLFPLPNVVLLPHVVQPLHIFEPRYCELLEDALATDRLIALVRLEAGWERDYECRPPIAPVACLGRIAAHQRTPEGTHKILLQGVRRAAIQRELPTARAFRQAEVDLLDDFYPPSGAATRPVTQRRLIDLARQLLRDKTALQSQLDELLASRISLGVLTDIFGFTLGLDSTFKQRLLAEWNVDRRATLLIENLSQHIAHTQRGVALNQSRFPPAFSLN